MRRVRMLPDTAAVHAACSLLILLSAAPVDAAQAAGPVRTGEQVYRAACAACHGNDGAGVAQTVVGFDIPLPDFTDCSFATREPMADWFAITHTGGPARAFDRRMPAFGDALGEEDIERTLEHVRTFCGDPAWPRGELNLPRPLVTEKAYPEDEAVLTTSLGTGDDRAIANQFLYERRFGARNQFEVAVPLAAHRSDDGGWQRGMGDVAVAVKRVLAHSLQRGYVLSATGEVVLPTGKETQGLGKGTTVFEPFVTFGQLLPRNAFVHVQVGAEIPKNRDFATEAFWRAATGRTFEQGRFGRSWSPMVEVLGAREMASGERALWDVVPQMQVTLSKRQHIMLNGGVRVPLNDRAERSAQVIVYFLWDWFDGGLLDGWR